MLRTVEIAGRIAPDKSPTIDRLSLPARAAFAELTAADQHQVALLAHKHEATTLAFDIHRSNTPIRLLSA